ncbi:MAG: FAD-dependent oxidoreductase [Ferruginibacter sp.]
MDQVTIVGGGIIGLCSAYYLNKAGYKVIVIERGNLTDGCSFGNMGFISPSHFVPLASPGIISEGFKYMLSSSSPFYVKPRINLDFIKWGYNFYRNSNEKTAKKNGVPLYGILKLSRSLIKDLTEDLGDTFNLEEKGCLMMCRQEGTLAHEHELATAGELLGLKVERLSGKEVQQLEPDVEVRVAGAVLFKDDCHFDPGKLMKQLADHLKIKGVEFHLHTTVSGFEKKNKKVTAVLTPNEKITCDHVVIAAGSWLPVMARMLGSRMLLQPGKGYSYTYEAIENNIKYPAILVDGRCAISPWGSKLRIGGTMELSGINNTVLLKRMQGIYNSVKNFYPGLHIDPPAAEKIWHGLRPVTPDGLPYLGKSNKLDNVIFAGGHAMLGLSQGTGTGKVVTEIIQGKTPSADISAFNPDRYS